MRAAEMVYKHKKKMGLPILDQARERAVIERNTKRIEDEGLKEYYKDALLKQMTLFADKFNELKEMIENGRVEEMRQMMRHSTARRALFDKK